MYVIARFARLIPLGALLALGCSDLRQLPADAGAKDAASTGGAGTAGSAGHPAGGTGGTIPGSGGMGQGAAGGSAASGGAVAAGSGGSGTGGVGAAGTGAATNTGGSGIGGRGGATGGSSTGGSSTGGVGSGGKIAGSGGAASGGATATGGVGGAGTGGAGAGGACPLPQMMCGSACIAVQNDAANCGHCDVPCAANQICMNGACQCAAPKQTCSGSCIDTSNDLHNCGACGRDCRYGTCSNGKCDPVLLATATPTVALTSDGASVYALDSTNGYLYGCPLSQCGTGGTMSRLLDGLSTPQEVLSVPSVGSVFISQFNAGVVRAVSSTGTPKSMITIPSASLTMGLATDGTNLYIGTASSSAGIQRTAVGANSPASVFPELARELLYDSTSNSLFAVQLDRIAKCPLSGTTCTPFFPQTQQQMNAVAVAGGKLFITLLDTVTPTSTKTGLFSCPTSGATCAVTPMLSGPAAEDPFWMTADASYVYLTMRPPPNGYGIYRCPLSGCGGAATFVTPGNFGILRIANDAAAIYWSSSSTTAAGRGVYRLAKQP